MKAFFCVSKIDSRRYKRPVQYTMYVTMHNCMYWSAPSDQWDDNGCKVDY